MTTTIFLSMLSYIFIMTYTPGPANILSLNVSGNYGFKQFLHVLAGLFTGFTFDMILCAIINYGFQQFLPKITSILTYLGSFYIIWLAIHIYNSKPVDEHTTNQKPSFLLGFFLQLSNIKIIFYGFTVFATYVTPYFHSITYVIGFIIFLPLVGASSCTVWALFGQILSNFLHKYYKICNTVMSFILLWCVYEILFVS